MMQTSVEEFKRHTDDDQGESICAISWTSAHGRTVKVAAALHMLGLASKPNRGSTFAFCNRLIGVRPDHESAY